MDCTRPAYTFGATGTPTANDQYAGSPDSKESWQPTRLSSNGLPVFTANFTGQPLANSVSETMTTTGTTTPFSQAQNYIMELDLGLKNIGSPAWTNPTATTIKTDAQGNPVDAAGNALGVSKYGYYNLATGVYGKDAAGHDLLADDKGFYYTDPVTNENIYGTITVGGNQNVSYDNTASSYYFTDTTVTPNAKCYDVTVDGGGTTHPAYSDADGSYYNGTVPVAGGGAAVPGKVYGTFDDAGTPRLVQHDATGYFYIDGANARQAVTNFDKITTSKVKPDTYAAIDNANACRAWLRDQGQQPGQPEDAAGGRRRHGGGESQIQGCRQLRHQRRQHDDHGTPGRGQRGQQQDQRDAERLAGRLCFGHAERRAH